MNYEECMRAVLDDPEADAPRRALAQAVRPTDEAWSRFIDLQLDMAIKNRTTKYHPGVAMVGSLSCDEADLLDKHKSRWTENLRFYLGELPSFPTFEFHRGLPWLCSMSGHTFLEQGEYIFDRVAPLRGIEFVADPDGDPFPMKEIAASPLLARLDEIRFAGGVLGERDLELLAASEHLDRVMYWDIRRNSLPEAAWEVFAANPKTRKCLGIRSDFVVPSDGGPLGELTARFEARTRYFEMSKEGRELERKYGYIPWLHHGNVCEPADAHYFVNNKVLPLFVPGSQSRAPTPFGAGIGPVLGHEPREKFDTRDFWESWY